ncbi:MAG: LysE family transporter [Alicyclobacillaceae bacterium]|nr:LysE family transporter [Alicyclobacillaceae bacterium]
MVAAALHGFLLAFSLILPIGVQNAFILTQGAVQRPWRKALPSVITASLCDTCLIAAAVFGVGQAAVQFPPIRWGLGLAGVAFLLYMGWSAWKEAGRQTVDVQGESWPVRRQIQFAASVSLLNPHAILDTVAVIGGSALAYADLPARWAFAVACMAVSWIWFTGLSLAGHAVGRVIGLTEMVGRLQRGSALVIWASAVYLGVLLFRS